MSEPPLDPEPIVEGWSTAPVDGSRIDVSANSVVAGDPGGARVEIASDGLHAYNAANVETATIRGEEGVFVGGEFRTSDTLPGQVTISDTANQGTPGIAVEPDDSTGYDVLPSIGPGPDHMSISGGVSTEGALAGAQFSANGTTIYHNGPGANGTGSWAAVGDGEAGLTYRPDRTNAWHESAIRARTNDAVVHSVGPSGTGLISASQGSALLIHSGAETPMARSESRAEATPEYLMLERKPLGVADRRRLILDDDGVWVKTNKSGSWKQYNLEETAQDSGWQPFTVAAGVTPSATLAWRNKGGIIFFRGTATGAWTANTWNTIATGLDTAWRPGSSWVVNEAGASVSGAKLRMTSTGELAINPPATETRAYFLTAMTYPAG